MKKIEPYFLDDRVIIPDDVKNMSIEELDAEIERLERESKEKKAKSKELDLAI